MSAWAFYIVLDVHGAHHVGVGVMSEELVWVSVEVTVFTSSFRMVVITFLPRRMMGTWGQRYDFVCM
jgi:hypothetical protein